MSNSLWCDFTDNDRLVLRSLCQFRDRLLANYYGAAIVFRIIVDWLNSAIKSWLCLIGIA